MRAGAFDYLHPNRAELFESLETVVRHVSAAASERGSSQVSMFAVDGGREPARLRLKDRPDWPPMERLKEEFDALGFYLSAHPLDAYAAARAALAGHGLAVPKDQNTSGLRAILTARRGAVKARTAAINQIKALLITAPAELRERYRRHTTTTLIRALARCRPAAYADSTTVAMLIGCKALAQRIAFLEDQDRTLTAELDRLVTAINPGLRAAYGVGPDTAAQLIITAGTNPHRLHNEAAFAMLCGTAPIPASSGKTNRHRLSRGGDRAANNALHRIALVRMSSDERTRAYVTAQLAKGRSKLDILRLLKRAVAREAFRLLTQPCAVDDYSDLRPARQAKNITLSLVADHFGVWPNDISRLERGLKRDDTLAANYRLWLSAA